MKIKDILKAAGTRLLREVPGVDVVLDVVEAVTGDRPDKGSTTADQLRAKLESLPPETQSQVLELDIETIRQQGATMQAMLLAESKSSHTTRPLVVRGAFYVVAFVTVLVVSMWAYAVLGGSTEMVETIMDGWPWVAALLVPFIGWLNAYFGILKTEHQNRLDAAQGRTTKRQGLGGLIETLRGN